MADLLVAEVGTGVAAVPDAVLVRKTFGADEHRFVSLDAVLSFVRSWGDSGLASAQGKWLADAFAQAIDDRFSPAFRDSDLTGGTS